MTETANFCGYCDDYHEMMNFGKDFSGNETNVCPDRLSDALVKTMERMPDEVLDAAIIERPDFGKPYCKNCGASAWVHKEFDYTGETETVECEEFEAEVL